MKAKALILLGVLFFFLIGLKAQTTKQKVKTHKAWITLVDGSKVKGNLYAAGNEVVKLSKNNSFDFNDLTIIRAQDIQLIKIRRKGKIGNSILIGGLSGAGLSILLGATTNDTGFFTKGEVMVLSGILFVPLGVGIGALAGTKKESFNIGGNLKAYQLELKKIQSYALQLAASSENN